MYLVLNATYIGHAPLSRSASIRSRSCCFSLILSGDHSSRWGEKSLVTVSPRRDLRIPLLSWSSRSRLVLRKSPAIVIFLTSQEGQAAYLAVTIWFGLRVTITTLPVEVFLVL